MYRTIKDKIKFSGKGLHTGSLSEVVLEPEKEFSGINFFINGKKIPAEVEYVVSTQNCTVLGNNSEKVYTVEHLLSSLYGLGITDINIYVFGDEIPSFDGSAKMFVDMILNTGFYEKELCKSWEEICFDKEIEFKIEDSSYKIFPSLKPIISCEIKLDKIGFQSKEIFFSKENYVTEISSAKTYCYLSDVEKIRSLGLGKGGSLKNVIVIGDTGPLNPEIMSFQDEFVRHKILDFIGDFCLYRKKFFGKIQLFSPNHRSNIKFIKFLKSSIQ